METSTLLQICQVAGLLVVAVVFVVMIKSDVKVLKVQMDSMTENLKILNNSFSKLSDVLSATAVQAQRISRVEEDIRELRHGRGFVQAIQGEWNAKGQADLR